MSEDDGNSLQARRRQLGYESEQFNAKLARLGALNLATAMEDDDHRAEAMDMAADCLRWCEDHRKLVIDLEAQIALQEQTCCAPRSATIRRAGSLGETGQIVGAPGIGVEGWEPPEPDMLEPEDFRANLRVIEKNGKWQVWGAAMAHTALTPIGMRALDTREEAERAAKVVGDEYADAMRPVCLACGWRAPLGDKPDGRCQDEECDSDRRTTRPIIH